ncbi:MAG: tRNA (N6-threonylcarbamoyladenosine(37)-N6)-methyltransferase TrmO [Candidatus Aminicenantes bacterium]|jgi:tRNA-Thr(GGU) m(6)t(6)A37 methyltransferase TsaA
MTSKQIHFEPIGIVHSPFKNREDIPRKTWYDPHGFDDIYGEVEVFKTYEPGLDDIDGFSHLILIFVFHESRERNLYAHPPYDNKKRGVFSTRSPRRPNPIGMTVVKLEGRERNILKISGLDMFEGTPVLDIKPYTQREIKKNAAFGWIERIHAAKESE